MRLLVFFVLILTPLFCSAIMPDAIINIVTKQVERDIAYFAKRMGWKHYRYTSKLRNPSSVTNLSKCLVDLETKASDHDIINSVRYKVTCNKAKNNQKWSVNVNANISYFMDVASLNKSIKKGQMLQKGDIVYVEKKVRKHNGYFFKSDNVFGEITRRKLQKGNVLKRKDIKVDSLVQRDREVLIVIEHQHLNMTAEGIPLKSAGLGEIIKVKNKRSGNVITAKVIGQDKVVVKIY